MAPRNFAKPEIQFFSLKETSRSWKYKFSALKKFREAGNTVFLP